MAVIVVDVPAQMVFDTAVAVTVGIGLTITETVKSEPVQLKLFETIYVGVTVYVNVPSDNVVLDKI